MELNKIYNEDCIIGMSRLPDNSVDCIICDLPFGITQCGWDVVIPFGPMWEQINRVKKPDAAVVLFGVEPFSSKLRLSNISNFRYDLIWNKRRPTGQLNAKKRPLSQHEVISLFYDKQCTYNPIMHANRLKRDFIGTVDKSNKRSENYGKQYDYHSNITNQSLSYPRSIIEQTAVIGNSNEKVNHPTQKPVALIEYLIRTFSNENDTVLDFCIGSGTTAVAAINTSRNYIGFETDKTYYQIACDRIREALREPRLAI